MATGFNTPSQIALNEHVSNAPKALGRMRGIEKILAKIGVSVAALFGVGTVALQQSNYWSNIVETNKGQLDYQMEQAKMIRDLGQQISLLQELVNTGDIGLMADASTRIKELQLQLQTPDTNFLKERSTLAGKLGRIALQLKDPELARTPFNYAKLYAELAVLNPATQEWFQDSERIPPIDQEELLRQMRERFATPPINTSGENTLASAGGGAEE